METKVRKSVSVLMTCLMLFTIFASSFSAAHIASATVADENVRAAGMDDGSLDATDKRTKVEGSGEGVKEGGDVTYAGTSWNSILGSLFIGRPITNDGSKMNKEYKTEGVWTTPLAQRASNGAVDGNMSFDATPSRAKDISDSDEARKSANQAIGYLRTLQHYHYIQTSSVGSNSWGIFGGKSGGLTVTQSLMGKFLQMLLSIQDGVESALTEISYVVGHLNIARQLGLIGSQADDMGNANDDERKANDRAKQVNEAISKTLEPLGINSHFKDTLVSLGILVISFGFAVSMMLAFAKLDKNRGLRSLKKWGIRFFTVPILGLILTATMSTVSSVADLVTDSGNGQDQTGLTKRLLYVKGWAVDGNLSPTREYKGDKGTVQLLPNLASSKKVNTELNPLLEKNQNWIQAANKSTEYVAGLTEDYSNSDKEAKSFAEASLSQDKADDLATIALRKMLLENWVNENTFDVNDYVSSIIAFDDDGRESTIAAETGAGEREGNVNYFKENGDSGDKINVLHLDRYCYGVTPDIYAKSDDDTSFPSASSTISVKGKDKDGKVGKVESSYQAAPYELGGKGKEGGFTNQTMVFLLSSNVTDDAIEWSFPKAPKNGEYAKQATSSYGAVWDTVTMPTTNWFATFTILFDAIVTSLSMLILQLGAVVILFKIGFGFLIVDMFKRTASTLVSGDPYKLLSTCVFAFTASLSASIAFFAPEFVMSVINSIVDAIKTFFPQSAGLAIVTTLLGSIIKISLSSYAVIGSGKERAGK